VSTLSQLTLSSTDYDVLIFKKPGYNPPSSFTVPLSTNIASVSVTLSQEVAILEDQVFSLNKATMTSSLNWCPTKNSNFDLYDNLATLQD
jgi:hypothetical protein